MASHGVLPQAGDGAAKKDDAVAAPPPTAPAPPVRRLLLRAVSLLGLASLCFLLGAAVIYFDVWPAAFLTRAFGGAHAWYLHSQPGPRPDESGVLTVGKIDQPAKTCDGFTLLMYGGDSKAVLVNMRGDVVHHWHVPFSALWPDPPHLKGPIDDEAVYFNDGHVYPNGDLAVVIEGPITTKNSSNGYGLAKLDKDSNVLWKYPGKCHHDLDVGDDGVIYALTNEVVQDVPPGLADIPTPCMVDCVDVISPDGKQLKRIPLLESIYNSPYAPLFCMLERPRKFGEGGLAPRVAPLLDDQRSRDVLHANAVKVLSRALAPKFPKFKAGQLLISVRHLDALVVLDPDDGKVVWAARGPWHAQHDPSFLDNGRLLLFDNLGSPRGSRVLEFDPQTLAFPWSYSGDADAAFFSRIRGMAQRLPNGNTLVVNSDRGEAFEVTPGREVVWSCSDGGAELYRARRYTPEQLPFLKGDARARP
jgi:hypothetical protein